MLCTVAPDGNATPWSRSPYSLLSASMTTTLSIASTFPTPATGAASPATPANRVVVSSGAVAGVSAGCSGGGVSLP
jgi:hypothetical protein